MAGMGDAWEDAGSLSDGEFLSDEDARPSASNLEAILNHPHGELALWPSLLSKDGSLSPGESSILTKLSAFCEGKAVDPAEEVKMLMNDLRLNGLDRTATYRRLERYEEIQNRMFSILGGIENRLSTAVPAEDVLKLRKLCAHLKNCPEVEQVNRKLKALREELKGKGKEFSHLQQRISKKFMITQKNLPL